MYKAIRVLKYGGPDVMKVCELPKLIPKNGQIRLKIATAGVNPVDTYMREGWHSASKPCPYTPGLDCAGIVAEVGEGVKQFQVGDRVCSVGSVTGTYAEEGLFTEDQLYHIPSNITMREAAAIGTSYFTAYFAYLRLNPQPGEWVFIHGGTGGVGTALIQICYHHKCKVVTSTSNPDNVDKLLKLGANQVVFHNEEGYMDKVKTITKSGPTHIFEMLANKNLSSDLKILGKGGKVAIIGNRGEVTMNPRDLMVADGQIYGIMLFNANPETKARMAGDVFHLLSNDILKPIVGHVYSLEDAPLAHEDVIQHKGGAWGRIILEMDKANN
ncbi:hypothetical protein WA158_002501 [Blastocystis sp. Blastoise]